MLTQKHIKKLIDFNNANCNNYSYVYTIVTETDGKVSFHERTAEPCYGGLRKYKSTHGEEATQPEHKPGDLRHPFPEGTPVAVAVAWANVHQQEYHELLDFLFGTESPWIKGFKSPDNILWTEKEGVGRTGIILLDTDIDPTVFVNLCKIVKRNISEMAKKFNALRKEGCTPFEAVAACCLTSMAAYPSYSFNNGYIFSPKVDLKKFKTGEVNDLSKGTLKDRFDYSRREFHNLFNDPKAPVFAQELLAAAKGKTDGWNEYAKAVKEVVSKYV